MWYSTTGCGGEATGDAYSRLVEARGGRWRLLYLKVDPEVLRQRLADRNRRGDANALMVTSVGPAVRLADPLLTIRGAAHL